MYWSKKIIIYFLTFFIIVSINFFISRVMPGDPFYYLTMENEVSCCDVNITEETRTYLMEYYDLDKPLFVQYIYYLGNIFRGNFGISIQHNMQARRLIFNALPWTVLLMGVSFLFSTFFGILIGSYSAWKRGKKVDLSLLWMMIIINRIPVFILATLMLILFAAKIDWFPLGGAYTPFIEFNSIVLKVADIAKHLILPGLTLFAVDIASPYLLTRNTMIGVLNKEYITAARLRGLTEKRIKDRYGLRNSLIPVITARFMRIGHLIGGSVMVEKIFAYPGIGKLMFDSLMVHDYPVLDGILLITSLTVVLFNFIADKLINYLDGRVGYNEKRA